VLHFLGQHLWLIAAGSGVGVAGRYFHARMRQTHKLLLPDPTIEILRHYQLYGYNAHALVGTASGIRLWTCLETEGAIAYNDFGKVWLVPGDPLASAEDVAKVTSCFLKRARAEGCVVGFMPATAQFARNSGALGLRAVRIGSAPYFDLATWAPRGDRAKKARAGVNQARRAGVRVTEVIDVHDHLVRETACLCKSWLTTRRSAIRFEWLFTLDPFQHKEKKKYFTARDANGRLVGFLAASPIPARDGWYLEDVLRSKDAPNGTTDLLVVEVLYALKRGGAKMATLGTALMATDGADNPEVPVSRVLSRLAWFIARCFSIFYNFDGVRRFKAKFAPSWWESEYVLTSHNLTAPPRVLGACVRAIVPAGPSYLIARQLSRAWRRLQTRKEAPIALSTRPVIEAKGRNES